jgi:hypothetical protein
MPRIKEGAFQMASEDRLIPGSQIGDGPQALRQLLKVRRDE